MRIPRLVIIACASFLIIASGGAGTANRPGEATAGGPADGAAAGAAGTVTGAALPGGEEEMRALYRAYPGLFGDLAVRDGEWAILLGDEWYYWADGRLLPDDLRDRAAEFVAIRFYNYELGPLVVRDVAPELEERLRQRTGDVTSNSDPSLRFNEFLDTLYGISSRTEAERAVVGVSFLGRWTRVHPLLVEPLGGVERRIRAATAAHPQTAEFVAGLASVHAYNWRNIAGTQRRSYHSYGVALDLVPRSYGGRWAYWLWAAESGVDEWWKLPLDERWMIPQPVIDAFEAEGFIWGGKWLFFDHLHFEYRPESILMARD